MSGTVGYPNQIRRRPSSHTSFLNVPSKLARVLSRGAASSDPQLRALNDHRFIVGVPRAQRIAGCHPSSFCFRRRPIQFSMSAAVEAGEAVAGFASGVRHGGKGDGGVVEGASRLFVEKMHFSHHGE